MVKLNFKEFQNSPLSKRRRLRIFFRFPVFVDKISILVGVYVSGAIRQRLLQMFISSMDMMNINTSKVPVNRNHKLHSLDIHRIHLCHNEGASRLNLNVTSFDSVSRKVVCTLEAAFDTERFVDGVSSSTATALCVSSKKSSLCCGLPVASLWPTNSTCDKKYNR